MRYITFWVSIISLIALVFVPAVQAQETTDDKNPLAGTRWQLFTIAGEPIVDGTIVTLMFNEEDRTGGSAGCNSYGTTYTVEGETIAFGETMSTMMACMPDAIMEQEIAYLTALREATRYELADDQLVITYGEDDERLAFMLIRTLADTAWQLETISGEEVIAGSAVTLMFDDANGVVGSGGCNQYGGTYSANPEDDTISFSQIATTERACLQDGIMRQEQTFYDALLTASRFDLVDDRLTITYGDDSETLVFIRMADANGVNQ